MGGMKAGAVPMRMLVVGVGLIVAFHLVRAAAVSLPLAERPAWAAALWPGHPQILLDDAMTSIGASAARGQASPATAVAAITRVARKAPLEATPFLVRGAIAQTEGREPAAVPLFLHSRRLDPRAPASRYFLADHYLRTGQVRRGLAEMAVLSRLTPRSREAFVPALADYARTPGAAGPLSAFFASSPEFKPLVLETLAARPENAALVLRLAGPRPSPGEGEWQRVLLTKMVEAGDYANAYAIWRRLTGAGTPGGALHNADFANHAAPKPFNWSLHGGSAGVAEPAAGGGLQVIYYGRENIGLASQLLVLRPGLYRLRMTSSGEAGADDLAWSIRCQPEDRAILELPVKPGTNAASFEVPASGCPAQLIELLGRPGETGRPTELRIVDLALDRLGGR